MQDRKSCVDTKESVHGGNVKCHHNMSSYAANNVSYI